MREGSSDGALTLLFQDHGGWMIARRRAGWTVQLDSVRQRELATALSGVFKYAGVDVIWDELVTGLNLEPEFYDFNRDGLLAWTGRDLSSTVQFKLRDFGATVNLSPAPRFVTEPRPIELAKILFSKRSISWQQWIETWESVAAARESAPRLETPEADKAAGRV